MLMALDRFSSALFKSLFARCPAPEALASEIYLVDMGGFRAVFIASSEGAREADWIEDLMFEILDWGSYAP